MSELISPKTGLPFNQERVLEELRSWLTTPGIVKALLSEEIVTRSQLHRAIGRAIATLEHDQGGLSPSETAVLALGFLKNRIVRLQVAKMVAKREGIPRTEAMKDLWTFRKWLQDEYQVTDEGSIPCKEEGK
jgi:hypothetical protein